MRHSMVLLLLMHSVAYANIDEHLPLTINVDDKNYARCKAHTVRKAFVFKIAYVGLYFQDCNHNVDVMQMSDKLVRFNYQVNVKSDFFKEAAYNFFIKNLNDHVTEQQMAELNRFNQLYQNIQKNDCYDIYHRQGQQLRLYKNEALLGNSTNKSFAQQYFSIWFGQYPAITKLKKAFSPDIS